MLIETSRTILRPFTTEDLEDYFIFCSQEGVGEMAGWKAHKNRKESLESLQRQIENSGAFAIEYKADGKVIGRIAVQEDSENGDPFTKELGFSLNKDYQRRGIMQEVVCKIVSYLFSSGIQNIYACCMQKNIPSRKLIESCGFVLEKEGVFYAEGLGETFPSYEYVMHKKEWGEKARG